MFGRKPKVSPQMQDMIAVKEAIAQSPVPSGMGAQLEQQHRPPAPAPYFLGAKRLEMRPKMIQTPSGTLVPTGETETFENIDRVIDLTADDLFDILAGTKGTPIFQKVKDAMVKGLL